MTKVKPVPDEYPRVTPDLRVDGASARTLMGGE